MPSWPAAPVRDLPSRRPKGSATVTGAVDLVITGAAVYTGAENRPWASAVAVQAGRIVAVGSEDEVRDQVGAARESLHLPGRMLVAGFQDAHVHPPTAGRNLLTVSLHGLAGREAYLASVAAYAAAHPDEGWITGGGWAMEYFPGGLPRKEDLDAIVPDRPVLLFNRDVHGAWANSKALEFAGIDRDTPDPSDGRIERDPVTGEATGMLHEGAAYTLDATVVPAPSSADWDAAVLEAQAHLHSLGITAWQDAWVTDDTQAAYLRLAADGRLRARVVGSLWWERHQGIEQVDHLLTLREAAKAGAPGGYHGTTVKIMTDGVLENFTGALLEPYCDGCGGETDNKGLTYVDAAGLAEAVTVLDSHGFQVHMHAIGDRAVRNALDAVEAARSANGVSDNRHHIAHVQVIQPSDVPRFAALGVIANCQTYWAQTEPQMDELTLPFLGAARADLQYPFADLVRSGARLAMGSDWSVTTANPLEQIEVAVTRIDPANRANAPFLPDQRLTLDQALRGFTLGSAYVNHDERESGSIEVGKRADLAVLDRSLFAAEAGPIGDAQVELTLVGGQPVYER